MPVLSIFYGIIVRKYSEPSGKHNAPHIHAEYSGEEVDIQISSLSQDYNFYLIKVRDNGVGIPLKDQSRIFEKYERASAADRSRKGGASGFGLGLNYVFRVADAHGGKVCVESIEGEYSEFFLFLPSGEKK